MELSLNSDLAVGADSYHIQTEDWGSEGPYIVSRIYKNGAVIKSIKTPYSDVIRTPMWDQDAIGEAVQCQHSKILDLILSGQGS